MSVDIRRELARATNMLGVPLLEQPDLCARLQAVIDQPTEETWDNAFSIILRGHVTLWQAVIDVARAFPRVGPATSLDGQRDHWEVIPSLC